jgi:predicted Zn-dependent protease
VLSRVLTGASAVAFACLVAFLWGKRLAVLARLAGRRHSCARRTAVYLKRTLENAAAITRHQYRLVTPLDLQSGDVIARTPRAQLAGLEQELIRLAAAAPNSIQARLLLAQIYIQVYRDDDALTLLRATMTTAPRAYRPHAILAAWYARQEKWADAGREFETAIDLAGVTAVRFDYHYVAEVFEKAGDPVKAAAYRRRAQ